MKNIKKLLLIFILLFSFNITVKAEEETKTDDDKKTEEVVETKDDDKEKEEPKETTEDVKAELSNIKINGKTPECSTGTTITCKLTINDNTTKSVKVTFDVSKGATTDKKSGFEENIKEGTNKFSIKVTSSDENKTYFFEITKTSLETDSTLKSLSVNGQEISLKEDTLKYQSNVSYSTKKIEIKAIPNSDKAKVVDFKDNTASYDFYDSKKEIKIKVQAEDGSQSTYTLTVSKREEADVTLKSLTIKNHKIDFSSEVTDYEIKVLKNVSKLDIEAKATDRNANVKITNPTLQIGENTVKIEVSNDGNTNTYQIKVTKLDEDDKTLGNLKSLSIDNYEIDFSPNKYEYDLYLADENYLKIDATPKMEESEVEITGNLDLVDGSIIKIKVSYDDDIYNVYKLNIIKDGTIVPSKKKISKKAAALVISFDIISMAIMGVFNLKEKLNKNKKETNINKNNQKINIDDVDII